MHCVVQSFIIGLMAICFGLCRKLQ